MAAMLDWNDLKYFLAVAREGSTLAAGRALRVSQTTVARRIAALEQALGIQLFEKRQAGYALTPGRRRAARPGRSGRNRAAQGFADAAAAHTRDTSGTVRITTQEIYAVTLLAPMLRELHELHPGDPDRARRRPGLSATSARARPTSRCAAPTGDLRLPAWSDGGSASTIGRSTAAATMPPRNGVPTNRAQLKKHAFIGGGGGKLWRAYQPGCSDLGLEERVVMHHASAMGMLSAIRSGLRDRGAALHRRRRRSGPDPMRPAADDHGRMHVAGDPRARPPHAARPGRDRLPLRAAHASTSEGWKRSARPPLPSRPARRATRASAARRARPRPPRAASRRVEFEDRQRRNVLRDQQRDFRAHQRDRSRSPRRPACR